jgi:peptidoglycan/xylan/chitin deacetylase (PgdA/CDA1 family)
MPRERRSKYANDAKDTVGIASQVESLSSSLAQKVSKGDISVFDINKNKGLLDETYLSDTLKAQMSGTTVIGSTPPDDSITLKKTTFYKTGKNLFDKSKVSEINKGLITSTGELGTYIGEQTSDFIRVMPNTEYRRTYGGDSVFKVCYYDANKVFISGGQPLPIGSPAGIPIVTPVNCYFIRTSWATTVSVDSIQVELGTAVTNYDSYQLLIQKSYIEGISEINNQLTKLEDDRLINKNVQQSKRKPVITFVNDDGWEDDYTKLKGFSETYGIPFTSALIANGSTIKQDHALFLQNELGWEIASHTTNHVVLSNLATEEEIENELKGSKEILMSRGFYVKNLVYPQGGNDERVRRIAKKYYNCAATTNAGVNTGVLPSFYLKRYPLGSFYSQGTYEEYKAQVDLAVANNGWLIFMLHPNNAQHDATQQLHIEQIIQYIQGLNVDIMTLDDGYNIFGNVLEAGDYIGGSEGIAISKTGVCKNLTIG